MSCTGVARVRLVLLAVVSLVLLSLKPAWSQLCPSAAEIRERLQVTYVKDALVIGDSSPHGKVMLRLAAYAANPGMVNEPRSGTQVSFTHTLALDILRPNTPAQDHFIPSGQFPGATPEERAAAEQTFLAACGPTMVELAPKPPFRILIADQSGLGRYIDRRAAIQIPSGPNYLSRTHYTDFLVPKGTADFVKTDMYWPMSPMEAEKLVERLNATADTSLGARTVQATALVEVEEINPEFRTARIRLIEYALYNATFTEKLYDYTQTPTDADAATTPSAPTPDPSLSNDYFATRTEAVTRALALCEAHAQTATNLKCACVAEKVGTAWEASPATHIYTLLNKAVTANQTECANTDAQYTALFDRCRGMYVYEEFVARLGYEKACNCIAERAMELGDIPAYLYCREVEDYASRPSPAAPVASNAAPVGCTTIGQTCADGTIYAGNSPDGDKPMYVAAENGPGHNEIGDSWGPTDLTGEFELCPDLDSTGGGCVTGKANSARVVALNNEQIELYGTDYDQYRAVMHCEKLFLHGHDDWYLPARDELHLIFKNVGMAPELNMAGQFFWTSSHATPYIPWSVHFETVVGDNRYGGGGSFPARCVRTP